MFAPLRNYIFPRALALRLPGGLCSPNAFQSRYFARSEHFAHFHPTLQRGPFHTKRRRHLTIPAPFNGQLVLQFHIDFVLIVLLHIGFASSTTPHSIASDPAEEEALLCLEQGTQKLEEGDVEGAKKLYQRSVDIKRNASSLFNLGVTHYHLSPYSKLFCPSLFGTQPHLKRSSTKRSILGHLLLSSNHPARIRILVRTFLPFPMLPTQTWRSSTDLASAYLNHPHSRPELALQHLQ
jgi:hypothetical protein